MSTTFLSQIIAIPALVDSQKEKGRASTAEKESPILVEETGMSHLKNWSLIADFSLKDVNASLKDKPGRKRKSDAITESDQSFTIIVHTRTNPFNTQLTS